MMFCICYFGANAMKITSPLLILNEYSRLKLYLSKWYPNLTFYAPYLDSSEQ